MSVGDGKCNTMVLTCILRIIRVAEEFDVHTRLLGIWADPSGVSPVSNFFNNPALFAHVKSIKPSLTLLFKFVFQTARI